MLLRMPEYCRDFKCLAGACSDSCCIGWEIDIDEKTAEYYMSVTGEFGEKLRSNIQKDDVYSFILKNERCPFLNEENLCEIILRMGEDKLCHICDNHPRYYEWFKGVKEGGTGLCCEESARLILENGSADGYYEVEVSDEESEEYDEGLYNFLFGARERILALLREENVSLLRVVSSILDYADSIQDIIDNECYSEASEIIVKTVNVTGSPDIEAMLDIFYKLEPIDESWKPFIEMIKARANGLVLNLERYEKYLRNIGIYFIWRYFMKGVFDGEIISKVRLSVISMALLSVIFCAEKAEFEECIILAKNYSKEAEYSEENLETIFDMTYSEKVFSADGLKNFFG